MNVDRADLDIEAILGTAQTQPTARARRLRLAGWLGVLLTTVVAGPFLLTGSVSEAESFGTHPVLKGDLSVSVTATGTIQPRNEVSVGIEVSGTIAEVLVDFNDFVKQGVVLARLDTAIQTAEVARSQAALRLARAAELEAKATLTQTTTDLGRLVSLRKSSTVAWPTEQELDSAKAARNRAAAALESARAQVDQAIATLAIEQTKLTKAKVLSPINGVVLSRRVDPGQTVAATLQTPELFVLAEDLREIELSVDIDEADVGQVREGMVGSFTVDAYPTLEFPAQIEQVRYAPHSNGGVVTYEAILAVDNQEMLLRPGMTATAVIIIEQIESALLVPNEALRFMPQQDPSKTEKPRGVLSALLPRPPASNAAPEDDPIRGSEQRLWVLNDSGVPESILVRVGVGDGTRTVVHSDELKPGLAVITEQRSSI